MDDDICRRLGGARSDVSVCRAFDDHVRVTVWLPGRPTASAGTAAQDRDATLVQTSPTFLAVQAAVVDCVTDAVALLPWVGGRRPSPHPAPPLLSLVVRSSGSSRRTVHLRCVAVSAPLPPLWLAPDAETDRTARVLRDILQKEQGRALTRARARLLCASVHTLACEDAADGGGEPAAIGDVRLDAAGHAVVVRVDAPLRPGLVRRIMRAATAVDGGVEFDVGGRWRVVARDGCPLRSEPRVAAEDVDAATAETVRGILSEVMMTLVAPPPPAPQPPHQVQAEAPVHLPPPPPAAAVTAVAAVAVAAAEPPPPPLPPTEEEEEEAGLLQTETRARAVVPPLLPPAAAAPGDHDDHDDHDDADGDADGDDGERADDATRDAAGREEGAAGPAAAKRRRCNSQQQRMLDEHLRVAATMGASGIRRARRPAPRLEVLSAVTPTPPNKKKKAAPSTPRAPKGKKAGGGGGGALRPVNPAHPIGVLQLMATSFWDRGWELVSVTGRAVDADGGPAYSLVYLQPEGWEYDTDDCAALAPWPADWATRQLVLLPSAPCARGDAPPYVDTVPAGAVTLLGRPYETGVMPLAMREAVAALTRRIEEEHLAYLKAQRVQKAQKAAMMIKCEPACA